jgi:hypothetical protein
MAATIYPGQRVEEPGALHVSQWLSLAHPILVNDGVRHMVAANVCAASAAGTFMPLFVLSFLGWRPSSASATRKAIETDGQTTRRRAGILLTATAMIFVWACVPVPTAVGMPLLWHKVPPQRLLFAGGLLLLVLSLELLRGAQLRFTWGRVVLASALLLVPLAVARWGLSAAPVITGRDISLLALPLLGLGLAPLIARSRVPVVLLVTAAGANFLAFGFFNPIQSARPIMEPPRTEVIVALERLAARQSRRWLVTDGYPGAMLNGLGFASVSHLLIDPQLDFFRPYFADLDEDQFLEIFNRYGHIVLSPADTPALRRRAIKEAPLATFDPPDLQFPRVTLDAELTGRFESGGRFDYTLSGHTITVTGWGYLDVWDLKSQIRVKTSFVIDTLWARGVYRPDVALAFDDRAMGNSGFTITLKTAQPIRRQGRDDYLCLVSESPERGSYLLNGEGRGPSCREVTR